MTDLNALADRLAGASAVCIYYLDELGRRHPHFIDDDEIEALRAATQPAAPSSDVRMAETITSSELLKGTPYELGKSFNQGPFPPEERMIPARDGIEAQRGLNDVFPGDPYPIHHSDVREAKQDALKDDLLLEVDRAVKQALREGGTYDTTIGYILRKHLSTPQSRPVAGREEIARKIAEHVYGMVESYDAPTENGTRALCLGCADAILSLLQGAGAVEQSGEKESEGLGSKQAGTAREASRSFAGDLSRPNTQVDARPSDPSPQQEVTEEELYVFLYHKSTSLSLDQSKACAAALLAKYQIRRK